MKLDQLCAILSKYLPSSMVKDIAQMLIEHKVLLKIKRPRKSKLGDYRSPAFNGRHTISINQNLNKYAFAITLLHEIAHLLCFNAYKNRVKPHGDEWKSIFQTLLVPYLKEDIFPTEIKTALINYMKNPAASSCADAHLLKALSMYDATPVIFLDEIQIGEHFFLENGQEFVKQKKRRTRYLCQSVNNKKLYLISGVAAVKRI